MLIFSDILQLIVYGIVLLVTVAFFTLGERKIMGAMQRRKGPDVVGFWGILQPMADGIKLLFKEIVIPYRTSFFLFQIGPILMFALSLFGWAFIPLTSISFISSLHFGILFYLISSSLGVYGIILAGWSSNSRYAFLGGVRATAQMISYELIFGTITLFIGFFAGSFNFLMIVLAQQSIWFIFPLFPVFLLFIIVMLAETNRTPFDLAEAEAELVAGYNVEYSSIMFAMFFLGEYANMILLSVVCVLFFFGGWLGFVSFPLGIIILKILIFCFFFVWVRATLPRYRYDQLMTFGWKHLLPFSFGFLIFFFSLNLVLELRTEALIQTSQNFLISLIYSVVQLPMLLTNLTEYTFNFLKIETVTLTETMFALDINTNMQTYYLSINESLISDDFNTIVAQPLEEDVNEIFNLSLRFLMAIDSTFLDQVNHAATENYVNFADLPVTIILGMFFEIIDPFLTFINSRFNLEIIFSDDISGFFIFVMNLLNCDLLLLLSDTAVMAELLKENENASQIDFLIFDFLVEVLPVNALCNLVILNFYNNVFFDHSFADIMHQIIQYSLADSFFEITLTEMIDIIVYHPEQLNINQVFFSVLDAVKNEIIYNISDMPKQQDELCPLDIKNESIKKNIDSNSNTFSARSILEPEVFRDIFSLTDAQFKKIKQEHNNSSVSVAYFLLGELLRLYDVGVISAKEIEPVFSLLQVLLSNFDNLSTEEKKLFINVLVKYMFVLNETEQKIVIKYLIDHFMQLTPNELFVLGQWLPENEFLKSSHIYDRITDLYAKDIYLRINSRQAYRIAYQQAFNDAYGRGVEDSLKIHLYGGGVLLGIILWVCIFGPSAGPSAGSSV